MKSITNLLLKSTLVVAITLLAPSCSDVLEERPYTVFTTEYFKTAQGLQDAVNAAYSGFRYNYGPIGAVLLNDAGTDEWTYGDQPRVGNGGDMLQLTSYQITTANGAILTPWNRSFQWINLCNAIIEFAPEVDMPANAKTVILGEAHYLRAHLYMTLVQQFGAIPLDLGSGDLKFNQQPSTVFNRGNTEEARAQQVADNYEAIIEDLIIARQNLPVRRPLQQFKLSQSAAIHLLAKAYLHRAYSSAQQASDFQNAYTTAMDLIDNQAQYGVQLLQDYAEIHREGNDYNAEVMFSIERIPLNNIANESPAPGSDFANKVNLANNLYNCDYTQPRFPGTNFACIPNRVLAYGRPLRQFSPTRWLTDELFADKINDSRFDGTFRTVWLAATLDAPGTTGYNTYVSNLATLGLSIGDTAIYLAPTDAIAAQLKATKKYFVIGPSERYTNQNFTWNVYPNLKKHHAVNRANFNDASGRPYMVARLGETYLLAAEAALQSGQVSNAVPLINALRNRAAYRPNLSAIELTTRRAALQVTAGDIDLDFILDERSKELCGEGHRWIDLAVRKKLVDRVLAKNPDATNVQSFHVYRPIPQNQLNAISNPNPEQYQNPGY
jgi:hypothetical protein